MKITLNSTSFLLPNNESWSILKKNNNINFSDYGNINSGLNAKNKAEIDVTLFFLITISPNRAGGLTAVTVISFLFFIWNFNKFFKCQF